MALHSSLFGGAVNCDYIVTNTINSLFVGSRYIPNSARTNHCWANLAHTSKRRPIVSSSLIQMMQCYAVFNVHIISLLVFNNFISSHNCTTFEINFVFHPHFKSIDHSELNNSSHLKKVWMRHSIRSYHIVPLNEFPEEFCRCGKGMISQ